MHNVHICIYLYPYQHLYLYLYLYIYMCMYIRSQEYSSILERTRAYSGVCSDVLGRTRAHARVLGVWSPTADAMRLSS